MMRICLIGRGSYVLMRLRAECYARLGHDVHVVTLHPGKMEGVTVHALRSAGRSRLRYLTGAAWMLRTMRRIEPDIVDGHGITSYAAYGLFPHGAPLVATVYGPDVYDHALNSKVLARLARAILTRADLVYASSTAVHEYIRDILGSRWDEKIVTRSWGIPTHDVMRDGVRRRAAIRQELGVDAKTRVILHSRHIAALWRVDVILEAFSRVATAEPDCELWFAYPPPSVPGAALLKRLQERAREMGLAAKVRFLGYLPYERMISVMHASDVFVCVGKADLLASSLLEAMATGLVPILSGLPAYREVIQDGHNGVLLSEVDAVTVSAAILEVVRDDDAWRFRVMSTNPRIVRESYDQDSNSIWLTGEYEKLIARARGGGRVESRSNRT